MDHETRLRMFLVICVKYSRLVYIQSKDYAILLVAACLCRIVVQGFLFILFSSQSS